MPYACMHIRVPYARMHMARLRVWYNHACTYGMNYLYRMHMNTKYTCKYLALQFLVFRELFTIFQNRMDQMEVFIATYVAM